MNPKSMIIYSLVCCTSCWCSPSDSQDVTTISAIDDDSDPEMSAASTISDNIVFNLTTESPLSVTTINDYFSSASSIGSTSAVSRDRMGPVSSHGVNHKDKPKSEENANFRTVLPPMMPSTSSLMTEPLISNSMGAVAKPQTYHYYPHNEHMYVLPECAVQQVCSAVYVRLNYTQPLCACPSRSKEPCSASLNSDDLHTTELSADAKGRVLTLVKTCEPIKDMRLCRAPRDWSLLALQNVRTGKSHYLVICHCPESSILEGPTSHDQPTYASVPGIKVYGMVCVSKSSKGVTIDSHSKRKIRFLNDEEKTANEKQSIPFPYHKLKKLLPYVNS